MSAPRQHIEAWEDRGGAAAILRLFVLPGATRPNREIRVNGQRFTFLEAAALAGIPRDAVNYALHRHLRDVRGRHSVRRRIAPGPAPHGTKWCGQCESFRPLDDFTVNRSATTGYQSWCRPCMAYARRTQRARARSRAASERARKAATRTRVRVDDVGAA